MLVREKSISAGSRGAQSRELLRGGESRLSSGSGRGERGAASRRERERHFAPRRAPGGAEAPTGGFPLVRGEGGEWRARGRLGGSPPFDRQVSPRLERLGFVLSSSGRATEIKQVQNMWSFIGTTTTGNSGLSPHHVSTSIRVRAFWLPCLRHASAHAFRAAPCCGGPPSLALRAGYTRALARPRTACEPNRQSRAALLACTPNLCARRYPNRESQSRTRLCGRRPMILCLHPDRGAPTSSPAPQSYISEPSHPNLRGHTLP